MEYSFTVLLVAAALLALLSNTYLKRGEKKKKPDAGLIWLDGERCSASIQR